MLIILLLNCSQETLVYRNYCLHFCMEISGGNGHSPREYNPACGVVFLWQVHENTWLFKGYFFMINVENKQF